jgi:hypothetical protein
MDSDGADNHGIPQTSRFSTVLRQAATTSVPARCPLRVLAATIDGVVAADGRDTKKFCEQRGRTKLFDGFAVY